MMQTSTLPSPHKKHSAAWHILAGLLTVCLVVLIAAGFWVYQERNAVLRDTANRLLAPYGITVTQVAGVTFGTNNVTVSTINFRYADMSAEQSLQQVAVSYHPARLLNGQVDDIHIGEIRLQADSLPPLPANFTDTNSDTSTRTTELPFNSLVVDTLSMQLVSDEIDASLQARLQVEANPQHSFQLSGNIRDAEVRSLSLTYDNLHLQDLQALAPVAELHCTGPENCQFNGEISVALGSVSQNELAASEIELTAQLAAYYRENLVTLNLAANSGVNINTLTHPFFSGSLLELHLADPLSVELQPAQKRVTANGRNLQLALPTVRPGKDMNMLGMALGIETLSASWQPGGGSGQNNAADGPLSILDGITLDSRFTVRQVYTNMLPFNLWSYRFKQHLQLDGHRVTLNAEALLNENSVITAKLDHALDSGNGNASIKLPGLPMNTSAPLSSILSPLPVPADLLAGTIEANAELTWKIPMEQLLSTPFDHHVSGPLTVTLKDIGGYYNEIAFTGLSTEFTGQILTGWQLRGQSSQALSVASVDPGVPLSNILASYHIDTGTGQVGLRDAGLELFGGRISSEQLDYHLQEGQGSFDIRIDDIDLSQILTLAAYDAVSATGILSGVLPVTIQNSHPVISGGMLSASEAGGTIRYSAGVTDSGNPSLDLVYQALQDYRYNLLNANVDYQEDGELLLGVQMEGISPQLNQGQRINLNLNISDNIPDLLRSLQAGQSVTERVEQSLSQ